MSGALMTAAQARAGAAYSRGSANEAVSGLVTKNGRPMPPSPSYLRAQAEAERAHKLENQWKHYVGEIPGHFRQEPGQPDINVVTNRASTIVNTVVNFLCGKVVKLEVLHNGKPDDAAQAALDACWCGNDNDRMVMLSKLAQNGAIFGHVFLKIVEPAGKNNRRNAYCRPIILDPKQVRVETDPQDCDAVTSYTITWEEEAPVALQQLTMGRMQVIRRIDPDDPDGDDLNNDSYSVDDDATWETQNYWRGPNNTWVELGPPIPWPHPWAPVVDWQNLPLANSHWGMSDIPKNVLHLINVLNLTYSNINQIIKYHAHPWMYASGMGGQNEPLNITPGTLVQLQSPDAKLAALEAYGDIQHMLAFAADVRLSIDEQTSVPASATGRHADLPPITSGIGLQVTYAPLLAENTHKQRLHGAGYAQASLRMLSLCGYGDGSGQDGWEVCVHWPNPLPNDDAATAQLALAMKQVDVSQHSILDVFHLDYDQEQSYREQEAKDQMKAALAGGALPQPMLPAAPGQPGQPPMQQAGPPQNDPRVQQAQQVMKAAGAAMKAGARVRVKAT